MCGTAGAAVYVCESGDARYQTSIDWACDASVPDSPFSIRQIFDWVKDTGDALVFPDLSTKPLAALPASLRNTIRGFAAVPIVTVDNRIVGTICVFDVKPLSLGGAEVDALRTLARSAATGESPREPLTSVLDRRGADPVIARELARAKREQRPLSVILFDINPIRRADRSDAHSAGDPLSAAGESLIRTIRGSDLAIRWGREEVLVVLPGTGLSEARPVAERVRAAMHAGARREVAVSGGVAELGANDTFESVVRRANERVRTAKEYGHNRVA